MRALREAWYGIDRYWFPNGSPVALGIFRILVGILAFANQLMVAVDFDAWFTERGFVPLAIEHRFLPPASSLVVLFGHKFVLPFNPPRIDLLGGVTDSRITLAFFIVVTILTVLVTLGLWTRTTTIALAVGLVSLHHRDSMILHGGDTVLRICCLYLAMAPCGAACSLDRVIGLWRGTIKGAVPVVQLWAQRLVTFNAALIYFTTVWLKWTGPLWRNGTATWYTARLNEFKRFPVPHFLIDMPMVKIATWSTIAVELSLATLVFYKPMRKWVLLAGVGLHAYIEYSMNVPMFSFLMVTMYVCFFDGEEVTGWAKRWGERLAKYRVSVFCPSGNKLRPGPAAALQSMDVLGLVTFQSGDERDWYAVKTSGKRISARWASSSRLMGSWAFCWIPTLWGRLLDSALEPTSVVAKHDPEGSKTSAKRAKVKG